MVSSPIDCSEKWGPEFVLLLFFFFHAVIIPWLKNKMAYVKAELLTAVFHLFHREPF